MKTRLNLLQLTVLFIMAVFTVVHAADVGKDDILAAARKWIADNAIFQAELPGAVPEKATQLTDGDGKAMPLWRVDLAPAGYLVMSSDDTLPPVVAFNTKGSFEMPADHPLPSMLERQGEIFQTELDKPQTRGNELAAENQARWNALLKRTRAESVTPSTIVTAPMLTTEWNQYAPYNYFCPSGDSYAERAVTGCVPTAISQMLKYHEWPVAGSGTKSFSDNAGDVHASMNADFSVPYDWSLMRDKYDDAQEERNYGSNEYAVARLAMEMGVMMDVDYGINGTSGYFHNVHTLMAQYLGYSSSAIYGDSRNGYIGYVAQSTLFSRIRTEMTSERPAFVSYDGHTFIADGLGTMGNFDYYHFNYGWGGFNNGWYLLTDGYDSTVIVGATTNIQPKPVAVFKPMSCEQSSSFTLSWDFPKRLVAEAFRLTKTTGTRATTVISESISGTARSYTLTGQSGTATYTLEAKVGGSWQAVCDGVTVTVKTVPAAMLTLTIDDGLKSIAGKQVSTAITANNTLSSLMVTSSRPDILPASGISVTGSGTSRTVRLTPSSGAVGNVLLYVTATDAAGNTVRQTVPLAVMADEPLTWHTTKAEAFEAASANGKLVLMVAGRDTCPNTNYFRNTVCETADVKATLLASYELWYCIVDSSSEYSPYVRGLGGTLPWIAIVNPANTSKRLRGHGGFMSLPNARIFLDANAPYFSLEDGTAYVNGTTQTLELTVLREGAEIRYRLDGTAPSMADTLYSSDISLTTTTTISARAFLNGEPISDIVTKTYTFMDQVAKPVLSTAAKDYFLDSIVVTASCNTPGAVIRYTTNLYYPTANDPVFPDNGLEITEETVLLIRAFKDGMLQSDWTVSELFPLERFPEAQAIVVKDGVTMCTTGTPWTLQSTTYKSSPSAMQSGTIGNSASTVLSAKVNSSGTVSFWWKVSSQNNYDKLTFSIDGVPQENISGSTEWVQKTFIVTGLGDHYLTWAYSKNNSQSAGSDCGWVDDIVWEKDPEPDVPTLKSITISGDEIITTASTGTYICTAMWSDGTIRTVTPLWSLDPNVYATIDENGVMTNQNTTSYAQTVTLNASYTDGDVTKTANKKITLTRLNRPEPTPVEAFEYLISNNKVTIKKFVGEQTNVVIPELIDGKPVIEIGAYAFEACTSVTSVDIPDTVTTIGRNAFLRCSNITSIRIPVNVSSIGIGVFYSCSKLQSFEVDSNNEFFTAVDGVLFDKNMSTLIKVPEGMVLTSYEIPNSVVTISSSAFYNCKKITSINIPSGVTVIPSGAFEGCHALASISIPQGVTSIGSTAFCNCIALRSIDLPDSVTTIESLAFLYSGLVSIAIPANVKSIGESAFGGNHHLESIDVDDDSTYYSSMDGVLFDKNKTVLLQYPSGKKDTHYVIPDGVVSLGEEAFRYSEYLVSVTIPNGITTIGEWMFSFCGKLELIIFSEDLQTIEVGAFWSSPIKDVVFNGPVPDFDTRYYHKPMTFSVPSGMGWEEWEALDGITVKIREETKTLVSVAINGVSAIPTASEASYSCTATWNDETTTTVEPVWTITPMTYASVSTTGLVTNKNTTINNQNVTLNVSYTDGDVTKTASKTITLSKKELTGIAVAGDEAIANDGTATYTCKATWSYGDSTAVTPTWTVTPTTYASVSATGVVTNKNTTTTNQTVTLTASYTVDNVTKTFMKAITLAGQEPVTLQAIAITGNATVATDATEAYGCTATWSDGSTTTVVPTWTVTPTTYASVDANGVVTNKNTTTTNQMVTLSASYTTDGVTKTASKDITLEGKAPLATQALSLEAGWNWVGFNVLPENRNVGDVLGSAGFTANDVVQTNGANARFTGTAWQPLTLEFGKLYQIYVDKAVTMEISGEASDVSSVPLAAGWNWIANPTLNAVSPSELLHSGGWTANDRIQTGGGASATYTGNGWVPAEFSLESGKGYQIHSANEGTLTFPEPEPEVGEALYVVMDLSGGSNAASYPIRYSSKGPDLSDNACRTTELWLRRIPAGTFLMGSPEDEAGRYNKETQHEVTLTQDYYIGVFECTQKQWELVMGSNPSVYMGDCRPVECVSYDMIRGASTTGGAGWPATGHMVDIGTFMGKLQAKTGLTFDLPTEAQWEYACRAGTTTSLNSGKNLVTLISDVNMAELGRYAYNVSDGIGGYSQHTTVGSYLPNAWGLYDMHGNVYEWCLDWYDDYGTDTVQDPLGPTTGSSRVMRGGRHGSSARDCRSAYRVNNLPSDRNIYRGGMGFRIVYLP